MPDPVVVATAVTPTGVVVPTAAEVPVTSAWSSKINWTQVVAGASSVLTLFFGADAGISPWWQAVLVTGITLVSGVTTGVLKTWFTQSIHPSSLPKGS